MSLPESSRKEVSEFCKKDIVDVYWFGGISTIGVVLMRKDITKELRCYISAVEGTDIKWDIKKIVTVGSKVPETIARAIFPQYNEKYAE
jgi:hypothetical protein